ncbi:MAG: glycerol-3-phosphate dehydrogenase/oxidase [Agarilytica sp.]
MSLRSENLSKLRDQTFDVIVVGGGINGAVSAAALSAKGINVALVDKGDFASMSSSASSNLAWGGIKYLESHEYRLVNKLCQSRNDLMRAYPSTVKEIRFLTTIEKGFRFPPWFIYLGSCVYWCFGRFFTQAPKYLTPKCLKQREDIIDTSHAVGGVEYSDAYLFDNDARFVFNFIRGAMDKGCIAINYLNAIKVERVSEGDDAYWNLSLRDEISGETFQSKSNVLINAGGPLLDRFNQTLGINTEYQHLLSKGVHLIVDKISGNEKVLAFFASDGRLFFVIPMGRKTCIGTTDTRTDNPNEKVTDEDRQFILDNVNRVLCLEKNLIQTDIIAERCGVRPLAVKGGNHSDDWLHLSRKHVLETHQALQAISIFGGKLTDCINVGEEVAQEVSKMGVELKDVKGKWYGEPEVEEKLRFYRAAESINLDEMTWPEASEPLSQRYWRRYGMHAFDFLEKIRTDRSEADLLIENAEYTRCEIEYARDHEMITKLEDFLRRRSKIEMVLSKEEILAAKGLDQVCNILFGEAAKAKLEEYKNTNT